MALKNLPNWFFIVLSSLMISQSSADEDLFRLIDKHIVCDSQSLISNVTVHSIPSCAIACRSKQECGIFSMNHVFKNYTVTRSKKAKKFTCSLCRSTNVTTLEEKRGWSSYMKWLKDIKYNILDTDNKASPADITPLETWNIDCNGPNVTTKKNGIIIGIWDDRDGFRDLDKVKCFNWDAAELFSEKPPRLLYIHLEDYRQCPKDYVLTAITASNAAFRNVDNGKCTPLSPEYHIDYDHCVTVNSENKDGGSIDKWRPWKVQCPSAGPMVAVSLHRRRRIHTGLKCCVLKGLVPT